MNHGDILFNLHGLTLVLHAFCPMCKKMAEIQKVTELFQKLTTGASAEERTGPVAEVASLVKSKGPAVIASAGIADAIKAGLEDAASPSAREGALQAFTAIMEAVGVLAEPYVLHLLPQLLTCLGDKVAPVRAAAETAMNALFTRLCAYSMDTVLPVLFEGLGLARNWQTKVGALNALRTLAKSAPKALAKSLPEIVPKLTEAFADAKVEVKQAAQVRATCMLV